MKQASTPHKFWDEAVYTAVYLINRMLTPLLNYKSPYSLLFTQEPDYKFHRNFGYACYPYLHHYAASKLDSRSKRCAFIDYSAFHHGYRCISVTSGRIYISRDVIFTKNYYPFADNLNEGPSSMESTQSVQGILGSFHRPYHPLIIVILFCLLVKVPCLPHRLDIYPPLIPYLLPT